EHLADRLDFPLVADRRAGSVGVDVIDLADALAVDALHRHAHASRSALARGGNHVEAVRGGAVARHLAVNPGAAALGPLQLLQHHYAGPAGNHEPVAVLVVGAARPGRCGIEAAGHGTHGVEQDGQRPVELLAAAGKHHVLLAPLDQL